MSHHCHATGCPAEVPPVMFMCKRHWYKLPGQMKAAIWRNYRPGQCDDWRITHEYAEAAREAVRYIAEQEGVEPDTRIYDMLDPMRVTKQYLCNACRDTLKNSRGGPCHPCTINGRIKAPAEKPKPQPQVRQLTLWD